MIKPTKLRAVDLFCGAGPADYYLHGNKADQIRQVGNAVCPGVMRAICEVLK